MPQEIISQFDRKYALPIETYRQVLTISNRDSIPTSIRWQGMIVYVVSDSMSYILKGGTTNSDWVELGSLVNLTVRNNLTSTSTTDALSANQGRILNDTKIGDAPIDGAQYARKDGAWSVIVGGGGAAASWGTITGTLSTQTDLQNALNNKLGINSKAADSSKLDGLILSSSGDRFGVIPYVSSAGLIEVGKYIDFHDPDGSTSDYDNRITSDAGGLISSGPFTSTGLLIGSAGVDPGSGYYQNNNTSNRVKLSVWTGDLYGVGMGSGYTFGGLSSFALSSQMNSTAGQGFWWGRSTDTNAQGAMALTNDGKLTVASYMRLGFGTSDTTSPGTTHRLEINGSVKSTSYNTPAWEIVQNGNNLEFKYAGTVKFRMNTTGIVNATDFKLGL
ncbi:phage tail protein [Cellulophaga phage phi12:1]|uniref:Phage tail protein n=2 Tax=Cellulophaga phage phi12:1 TaxID=1327976 RepID=R9ZY24_9CAUD|nr:tail protein [Cellulophaga phage phi12:1]AGO48026.1 phage tail protein [Cellulophaga phage phi12:1]AGO48191.1 phage tail protein [Cellulophaga phage phi12:3]